MKHTRPEDWQGKISILIVPPELYVHISNEIPVELVKEWGMEGIVVSANKPYMVARETFQRNGIMDSLTYLDCASRFAGVNPQAENLIVLENPANLTELDIALTKCIRQCSKIDFLLFDSLTTMLIYNKKELFTRFAHRLAIRLKSSKITTFFLMVEQKSMMEVLSFLSTIADKISHLQIDEEGEVYSD